MAHTVSLVLITKRQHTKDITRSETKSGMANENQSDLVWFTNLKT